MAKKYSKRSLNKDYELDLTKYDFGSFLKSPKGAGIAGAAGMAGNLISGLSNGDPTTGAIGGALSGAASGAALGPLGMAGGAIIGGATSLFQANAAKKAKEEEEYRQSVQQSMQADQNYKAQLKNQQANIPTFSKGGELRLYPEGGKVKKDPATLATTIATTKPNDIMAAQRQTILKGGIDSDTLYETPDSPNSYFTALKGDSLDVANPYTQRFLVNWNNRYAKDQGFFYDPNSPKLSAIREQEGRKWNEIPTSAIDTTATSIQPLDWRNAQKYQKHNLQSNPQGRALGSGAFGVKAEGGYTIDYKGASHANGGIQVNGTTGNPTQITGEHADAEVEGNEVATKFPGEQTPYIFSHKLGFADKARKIEKKYSKRPNEKMSQDSMYMELGGLMQEQEEVRNKKLQYHLNKAKELGGSAEEDTFEKGGYLKGNSYDVSEEELRQLDSMGYKYQIIK